MVGAPVTRNIFQPSLGLPRSTPRLLFATSIPASTKCHTSGLQGILLISRIELSRSLSPHFSKLPFDLPDRGCWHTEVVGEHKYSIPEVYSTDISSGGPQYPPLVVIPYVRFLATASIILSSTNHFKDIISATCLSNVYNQMQSGTVPSFCIVT